MEHRIRYSVLEHVRALLTSDRNRIPLGFSPMYNCT